MKKVDNYMYMYILKEHLCKIKLNFIFLLFLLKNNKNVIKFSKSIRI